MKKPILLTVLMFFAAFAFAFSQTLKVEGYTIEIDDYEEMRLKLMGMETVGYNCYANAKKGKKDLGTYFISLLEVDGKISHFAVKDGNLQLQEPRLYYNQADTSFSFHRGTEKEGKEKAVNAATKQELLLSAMLIWAKLQED